MSRSRERMLKTFIISDDGDGTQKAVEVKVRYEEGGNSIITHEPQSRGLYLSVSPVTYTTSSRGYVSCCYVGFSGVKMCVQQMKRFSQKQLDSYVPDEADLQRMLDRITQANGYRELSASDVTQPVTT